MSTSRLIVASGFLLRSRQIGVLLAVWVAGLLAISVSMAGHAHRACAAEPSLHEIIDREIERLADGPCAPLCDDAEFLRRIWLDLAGMPPTAEQTRAFLADTDPDKRVKRIDQLLAADTFPRRMREWVSAMLLERRADTKIPDQQWNAYLERSFAENKPWDKLVGELIFSEPTADKKPTAAERFFLVDGRAELHQKTQDVSRLLLGRDVMCAQCHDHPTVDDFKQADYFGLYTFLQETPDKARSEFESVFLPGKKATGPRLPDGTEIAIPVIAKGQAAEEAKHRPRMLLAAALVSPDNRLFVRNSANRFWHLLLGRGLVHPLDMIHRGNPPSHPELLDALAASFASSRFDVKQLLREVTLSRAYQRSSELSASDASTDRANENGATTTNAARQEPNSARYLAFLPKPLSPEQMAWSVMQATGNLDRIQQAPRPEKSAFTYQNYINGRVSRLPDNLTDVMSLFVGVFGNPPGEPETTFNPAVGQSLFLMNEPLILDWLNPQSNNLIDRTAKMTDNRQAIDELYLTVLTRPPTDDERTKAEAYLARFAERRSAALGELAWSLLASAEFRFNH